MRDLHRTSLMGTTRACSVGTRSMGRVPCSAGCVAGRYIGSAHAATHAAELVIGTPKPLGTTVGHTLPIWLGPWVQSGLPARREGCFWGGTQGDDVACHDDVEGQSQVRECKADVSAKL